MAIFAPPSRSAGSIARGNSPGPRRRARTGGLTRQPCSRGVNAYRCSPARDRASTVEMRIGIDARELCGKPTGVGRHLSGLLRAWATDPAASTHTFVLYAPEKITTPLPEAELRVVPGSPGT